MAEKARTPRSGAEREAKYASKMKILFSKNFARIKKMTNIRYEMTFKKVAENKLDFALTLIEVRCLL